jgi:hypothetical protein
MFPDTGTRNTEILRNHFILSNQRDGAKILTKKRVPRYFQWVGNGLKGGSSS